MVFPLVEHIPYWTFNHIIKSKLRHLVIKGYCSRAYQCFVSRIQRGLGQLGFLVQNSVTALCVYQRRIRRFTSQLHAACEVK